MRQTLSKGMVAAAAATGILSLYSSSALADSGATGVAEGSPGVLSGNTVEAPVHVPINLCGNTVDVIGVGNPAFGNACVNEDSAPHKSHDASGHDDGKGAHSPSGGHEPSKGQGPEKEHAPWEAPGHHEQHAPWDTHGSGPHEASGASAQGAAHGSPGVGSGNTIQVPVDIPVNACGNPVGGAGLFNPVSGTKCVNDSQSPKGHEAPPEERHNPPTTERVTPPAKPPTTERVVPPAEPPTTERMTPPVTPVAMAETGAEGLLAASAASAALIGGGAIMYRRSRAASRR
ncbi:chaplin [Streptomyces torulosus]|uniref:chaplin n=1 Tax=Streptomyces torulosus TaxID=68276 RepID=UPI000D14E5E7|nr:chaplin family protein [Streptomyces torulosus]